MGSFRRTARAEDDLVEIWLYIAAENPNAADRLLEEIAASATVSGVNLSLVWSRSAAAVR